MRIVVVDTNVLLSNPSVINEFPDAEVIIPDTVLSEIDKLKTARVDAELRYKGREISRMLFELSEQGVLQHGVDLENGGRLKVVPLHNEADMPEGLTARSADDRILAVALQMRIAPGDPVTLVTNDLNMLLKAQSYGISVERIEKSDSFGRRFIVRPFQRYRIPISILAVALAVFAAIVYLVAFSPFATRQGSGIAALPKEFVDQISPSQQQVLVYLEKLDVQPKDVATQRALANLYYDMSRNNPIYVGLAIKHYEELLKMEPSDTDARTDLASCYFHLERAKDAIEQLKTVLRQEPNHVNANFNLGLFYLNGKPQQFQNAAEQFSKVERLTKDNPQAVDEYAKARTWLAETQKQAKAAGKTLKLTGGTL